MFRLMVQQSEKPARGKRGERMHGWADLFQHVVGLSLCEGGKQLQYEQMRQLKNCVNNVDCAKIITH